MHAISKVLQLTIHAFENKDENWFKGCLKIASSVCATQDDVSMIYEGLTTGFEVGLSPMKSLPACS
ncbi:MAG: ELM1/GtrOC1 family putative glycosyltransferase [Coraliomargaritaceae bacterium]